MRGHDALNNGLGRVKRNVNMRNASLANWATGTSGTTSLQPGSSALKSYEAAIAADSAITHDPYGHGTHVASVAAGRYFTPKDTASPDINGIAPKANIYDVRVLGDAGFGTVSDALEGIQWVIYHAKEYNIKVMNPSLATDLTENSAD
ncbi:MAG: S8 family serine peptidase [Betaproteobacteria bacterium]|nr:S8 family serine peptidase [Betaproteobacteria bacterium]